MIVLLFSVLLDGAHRHQAGRAIARPRNINPFLDWSPTLKAYPEAPIRNQISALALNTMFNSPWRDRCCRFAASRARGLRDCAAPLQGAQWGGRRDFPRLPHPPSILFIPLSTVVFQYGLFDTSFALILTNPTILIHSRPGC